MNATAMPEPQVHSGERQETPLVSVIIPAYNAETFILDALNSITSQDYPTVEIVVVDDGSRDGTVALVEDACPDAKIIQQTNLGAAAARNTGLKAAQGTFICFLDADDGWFPGKIRAQVTYLLQHPETGAVFHKWLVWRPDCDGKYTLPRVHEPPRSLEIDLELSGWIYHRLLLDCVVHTSAIMMRREVFEQVGFFRTELVTGEDYDYWLRISRLYKIDKLKGIYSYYRAAPDSLTSKPKQSNNEYNVLKNAIRQWGNASPNGRAVSSQELTKRLAKLTFDFGYSHFYQGSATVARGAFFQCLKHQPFRWRAMAYLLATFIRRH